MNDETNHNVRDPTGTLATTPAGEQPGNPARRKFIREAAVVGAAGAASLALAACGKQEAGKAASSAGTSATAGAASAKGMPEDHVAPGQLDEYYGIWSGGQSGEIRLVGLPSMRQLMRVPVFNPDFTIGWGITNESKRVLGPNFPPGGDCHHPHMTQTDGH